MWSIRILSGPMAGQTFKIQNPVSRVGRAPTCDVQMNLPGISKEHFEIRIDSQKVIITDLNSSNGTFVNGIKVNQAEIKSGDKISIFNTLFEITTSAVAQRPSVGASQPHAMMKGAAHKESLVAAANHPHRGSVSYDQKMRDYVDRVVMPGFYGLTKVFELKWVLLGIVGVYVILVTILSVIPMKQITSESVSNESRRRALTVARALAQANEKIIRNSDFANFRTDLILREEGIEDVYIVGKDGTVLAPAERAGTAPKETSFIRAARTQSRDYTQQLTDYVGAAVPIYVFDPEAQQNSVKAFAVVIYNPGSLSFDDGRAFSLLIQMLALAMILGGILYVILVKLVEYPIHQLNIKLDQAIRDGSEHLNLSVKYPAIQNLLTNINSLLARAMNHSAGHAGPSIAAYGSKDPEVVNLLSLMGQSAIVVKKNLEILEVNAQFENEMSVSGSVLKGQSVENIPDQALQKNIANLIEQAMQQPSYVHHDQLDYLGRPFLLSCQAITSPSGEVEYFFITFVEDVLHEGGAA